VAVAWLIADPKTADLAAHTFRGWLFRHEGWTLWNNQWYGGHHVPGYSLTFPPLAGWLGTPGAVALAGFASAVAMVALARDAAPPGARRTWAGWLGASGALANLVVGRGPFALGIAVGALALLVARRGRTGWAGALGALCAVSSPVAGVFVLVAAAAWWLAEPRRRAFALGAGAGLALLVLMLAFPEGGAERFVPKAFWPMLAVSGLAVALLRGRALRLGGLLYLALLVVDYLVPAPMGQNALRFGVLAGPVALACGGRGRAWLVVLVAACLVYLQWLPAQRAVTEAAGDPATAASYYRPLEAFLGGAAAPGDRVEVPATRDHWEAALLAPHIAIARGWERQLDVKVNGLFYDGRPLTPARYEAWLRQEGIRWIALPDAPLDVSGRAEARLLRARPAYLRVVAHPAHWTVFEFAAAPPPVTGPARVVAIDPDAVRLSVRAPGRLVLRRRWTRYWASAGVPACLFPAPGGWTGIRTFAAGRLELHARLQLHPHAC
jgi:hypothetical protein